MHAGAGPRTPAAARRHAAEHEYLPAQPQPPADRTQVLYEECGFRGDSNDYYSPANSCIDQVLQRRRGERGG